MSTDDLGGTDINDLDRLIGRYVSISQGTDGMAGFVVEVSDKVTYEPEPRRVVVLDYGYGFPVGADTIVWLTVPPDGETAPRVENPIDVVHQTMHDSDGGQCPMPDRVCSYLVLASASMRAFRVWQMRQQDAYWKNVWVRRAKGFQGDPLSVSEIEREARDEGAPPHILEAIKQLYTATTEEEADSWQEASRSGS